MVWNDAAVAAATRRAHHGQSEPRACKQLTHRAEPFERVPMSPPCEHHRDEEEPEAEREHERDRRQRPARDLRGQQDPDHEHRRREDVEDAMSEHGADQRRRHTGPARQPPAQHRDPRELPDPARQHGVREQADRERGEDERETRAGRVDRLLDRRVPRESPRQHREQVEPDRRDHPAPAHDRERIVDEMPVRSAQDEEPDGRGEERDDEQDAEAPVVEHQAVTSSYVSSSRRAMSSQA